MNRFETKGFFSEGGVGDKSGVGGGQCVCGCVSMRVGSEVTDNKKSNHSSGTVADRKSVV